MKLRLFCMGVLASFALASLARAQVTITFTGTAGSTALGYTSGQTYSFSLTTAASFPSTARSTFNGSTNDWFSASTDPILITTASGSGLGGTYAGGVAATELAAGGTNFVIDILVEGGGYGTPIGFTANGNPLKEIYVLITPQTVQPFSFATGGSYVDPVAYFKDYVGTYSFVGTTNNHFLQLFGASTNEIITLTSVQIIPEPSTVAFALGAVALGGVAFWRRRRGFAAQS